jgi:hypothetical protein
MVSFAPTKAETLADQHLYLEENLEEVSCLDCLAKVRVRKHSEYHTSIQWSADAVSQCAEFARRDGESEGRPILESCSRLKASISTAVREGQVHVGAINEPASGEVE